MNMQIYKGNESISQQNGELSEKEEKEMSSLRLKYQFGISGKDINELHSKCECHECTQARYKMSKPF